MSTKYKCPYCEQEIEYLKYTSDVTEWGTIHIVEDEEYHTATEGDMDFDSSETNDTTTECPECDHLLRSEDIITVHGQEIKVHEYKVGDLVKIIKDTSHHGYAIGSKLLIKHVGNKNCFFNKTIKEIKAGFHPYFTRKDIELVDKAEIIDNGESESDNIIIQKNKEEFVVDPMLENGAICPKCKYFFADSGETGWMNKIALTEKKYLNLSSDLCICPKCTHEFDKVKTFNKLIKKTKCQN